MAKNNQIPDSEFSQVLKDIGTNGQNYKLGTKVIQLDSTHSITVSSTGVTLNVAGKQFNVNDLATIFDNLDVIAYTTKPLADIKSGSMILDEHMTSLKQLLVDIKTNRTCNGCSKNCEAQCKSQCYSSCDGGCAGSCSGCTGCSSYCGGCTNTWWCDCHRSSCNGGCDGSCRGCSSSCYSGCTSCQGNCSGSCFNTANGGCSDCSTSARIGVVKVN